MASNIRFKYIHSVRVIKCSLVLNAFVGSFVRFENVCIQDFDEKYSRSTVTTATASTAIEAIALTMANGDKNLHPQQKGWVYSICSSIDIKPVSSHLPLISMHACVCVYMCVRARHACVCVCIDRWTHDGEKNVHLICFWDLFYHKNPFRQSTSNTRWKIISSNFS